VPTPLPDPFLSLLPFSPLLAVFGLLILGIWLIPFAEEIALISAGYLYYSGQSPLALVLGVTGAGVFLGDFLAFQLGRSCRHWGERLALFSGKDRWGRLLTPFVARYGVRAVFWARFLPGARLATHVLVGLTGMPMRPYVQVTLLSVGVYVPLMLLLAASWGEEITAALQAGHQVDHVTWGLLSVGVSVWVILKFCWSRGAVQHYGPPSAFAPQGTRVNAGDDTQPSDF
jgi:membrane protein DedA with SNARE-associated domain